MKLFLDIETGPAANAFDFKPEFEAPKNLRDPEKIRAALEEKEREWADCLALSAITGRILAVGVMNQNQKMNLFADVDEKTLLWSLWSHLAEFEHDQPRLVGWNIIGFDLPFLQRRSWVHNIPTPGWVFPQGRLSNYHTDLMRVWCGENSQDRVKFDTVARWLGLGGKTDPEGGKNFAKLWKEDRMKAIEYLTRDVDLTRQVADRMREA